MRNCSIFYFISFIWGNCPINFDVRISYCIVSYNNSITVRAWYCVWRSWSTSIITNRTIIKSLRDELVNAGKYSVKLPDGSFLSWKQIDTEGTLLAEVISDPTLPRGDLIKILDNFKVSVGKVQKLNKVGYNAVNKATKKILQNWADINTDKAYAYFATSEAGTCSVTIHSAICSHSCLYGSWKSSFIIFINCLFDIFLFAISVMSP